jgi:hypothetical protein
VIPWAVTICQLSRHHVQTKSASLAARVVMALAVVHLVIVHLHAAHAVLRARTPPRPMAAISLLKPLLPPLSAYVKSRRQPPAAQALRLPTEKENKHAATRSSEIPQRAKRP